MDEHTCKHCGGPKAVRNPRGDCDHLYWPDNLTDEAKRANGIGLQDKLQGMPPTVVVCDGPLPF